MVNIAHEPTEQTRSLVKFCACSGAPHQAIARALGVSLNTLKKHYKEELQKALTEANARVVNNLYKMTKKHPAAAIFWLKAKAGWSDRGDPVGADNLPAAIKFRITAPGERIAQAATDDDEPE